MRFKIQSYKDRWKKWSEINETEEQWEQVQNCKLGQEWRTMNYEKNMQKKPTEVYHLSLLTSDKISCFIKCNISYLGFKNSSIYQINISFLLFPKRCAGCMHYFKSSLTFFFLCDCSSHCPFSLPHASNLYSLLELGGDFNSSAEPNWTKPNQSMKFSAELWTGTLPVGCSS